MLVLYVSLLVALALVQVVLRWRVRRLERRFVRVAAEADTLLKHTGQRGGTNRTDPFLAARQQYELARLGMKRDRVERRYTAWQSFCENFSRFRGRLTGYRGKVLPYLVGAFDVAFVIVALDQFGVGPEQVKALLGLGA
jgi:hypothetical protein